MRYYLDTVEEHYGSMNEYLETEMLLDKNDLSTLREKYTVPIG